MTAVQFIEGLLLLLAAVTVLSFLGEVFRK